jgi:polar amino acid transport system ATP-binding protein
VLAGASLSVDAGEVLAIMGRSGSGKSTLLRVLALLERADVGDAWLDGAKYLTAGDPVGDPVRMRRQIAMVFQNYNLVPHMTVLRNCTLGPVRALQEAARDAEGRAMELLHALGLAKLAHRYPGALSGGEAQRVAVARALLMRPRVLLLDEVTAALDPESVYAVLNTIRKARDVAGQEGLAIILVTHLLPFAEQFANRIAFLDGGKLVEVLPGKEFARHARSEAAVSFIKREQAGWSPL